MRSVTKVTFYQPNWLLVRMLKALGAMHVTYDFD